MRYYINPCFVDEKVSRNNDKMNKKLKNRNFIIKGLNVWNLTRKQFLNQLRIKNMPKNDGKLLRSSNHQHMLSTKSMIKCKFVRVLVKFEENKNCEKVNSIQPISLQGTQNVVLYQ